MTISSRLSILLCLSALLFGCSNDDDGKAAEPTGYVAFFNAVADAPTISLEGESRNYGSVNYENFGSSISLESKTYSVNIVSANATDSSADVSLATESFTVTKDSRTLYAVSGTSDALAFHKLTLATDQGAADTLYLNVSHLSVVNKADTLKVYFLDATEDVSYIDFASLSGLVADAEIAYGASSASVPLTSGDKQRLVVANSTEVVFDSGMKTLTDASLQTLLLADYTNIEGATVISAYYYHASLFGVAQEIWRPAGSTAYVKLVNLLHTGAVAPTLTDSAVVDATLTNNANLIFADSNAYDTVLQDTYSLSLDVSPGVTYQMAVNGGTAQTAYIYAQDKSPVVLTDDKSDVSGSFKLKVTHLAYAGGTVSNKTFNLHLIKDDGTYPSASTVTVSGLGFQGSALIQESDYDNYKLYVTPSFDNSVSYPPLALTLGDGDNKQVIIYDVNGSNVSFNLLDVTQDIPVAP